MLLMRSSCYRRMRKRKIEACIGGYSKIAGESAFVVQIKWTTCYTIEEVSYTVFVFISLNADNFFIDPQDLPVINDDLLSSLEASDNLKDGNRLILKDHLTFMECRYFEARSPQEIEESISDVNKLASLLRQVDAASMHILRCKGTTHQVEGYNRSLLFYEIPCEPTNKIKWTLTQAIEGKHALKPCLNIRVRYAVEISMAVMFTHAAGLVHKSISPQNVISEWN